MRHGQTRFNEQRRIQGVCDSPLTELGIKQAQQAADYFKDKGIVFEEIYSSTQERACDTAEIVSGRKDIIRLKGLKEWDFGTFEGQQEYLNTPCKLVVLVMAIILLSMVVNQIKTYVSVWERLSETC